MDENEDSCISPQVQQQRWRRHFSRVPNIHVHNIVDMEEMDGIRQCHMAQERSLHEVDRALGKLRNGKAPGRSNILPEMVKAGRGNEYFKEMLLDLISSVWQEQRFSWCGWMLY